MWYTLIHDIIPTRDRLYSIDLATDNLCMKCKVQDTLMHRLIECGEGTRQWMWSKTRLALMLRVDPYYIPDYWLLRPHFQVWPPQKHKAVLWLLVRFVEFRCQPGKTLTLQDFYDFLQRSKKKLSSHESPATGGKLPSRFGLIRIWRCTVTLVLDVQRGD
jgi:hypothetical protein